MFNSVPVAQTRSNAKVTGSIPKEIMYTLNAV